jgi:thiol-disulfide isomerase/thioredoxin
MKGISNTVIMFGVVIVVCVAALWFMGVPFGREMITLGFQNSPPSENTFTMYYADWCPHCQKAKPEFKALVDKGYVGEGKSRCKVKMYGLEENPEAVKGARVPIKGFPTFILETPTGAIHEYEGSRSTDGYLAFINEKLGGGI